MVGEGEWVLHVLCRLDGVMWATTARALERLMQARPNRQPYKLNSNVQTCARVCLRSIDDFVMGTMNDRWMFLFDILFSVGELWFECVRATDDWPCSVRETHVCGRCHDGQRMGPEMPLWAVHYYDHRLHVITTLCPPEPINQIRRRSIYIETFAINYADSPPTQHWSCRRRRFVVSQP